MRKFFLSIILHFVIQYKVLRYVITNFGDTVSASRLILTSTFIVASLIGTIVILANDVNLVAVLRFSIVVLLWLYTAAIVERITNKEKPWNY